jgi:hypothetical protein
LIVSSFSLMSSNSFPTSGVASTSVTMHEGQSNASRRLDLLDTDVLGDGLLESARDELFDLVDAHCRPGAHGHRRPDRDVRIFALAAF